MSIVKQGGHCSSEWLRTAVEGAEARDPVDAANDAEQLLELLRHHDGASGSAFMGDPATSHWLKRAYSTALARPAAESMSDALLLLTMTQDRLDGLLAVHAASRCS